MGGQQPERYVDILASRGYPKMNGIEASGKGRWGIGKENDFSHLPNSFQCPLLNDMYTYFLVLKYKWIVHLFSSV